LLEIRFDSGSEIYKPTAAITENSWNIFGCSFDEATTNIAFNINGTAQNVATIAAPGPGGPGDPYFLMASQGGANEVASGTRLAFVAMWNTNIGATALANLYTILKSRRLPSAP